jgi:hypothetical protein
LSNREPNLKATLEGFREESITEKSSHMESSLYRKPSELGEFSKEEQEDLHIEMEELKAWWDIHDIERLLAVTHTDVIYHDITLPPAKGHCGLQKFADGWLTASSDFSVFIEKFISKGNYVLIVGRISGTITREYFGLPATKKPFDCLYCQVAVVENGKIKYVRAPGTAIL